MTREEHMDWAKKRAILIAFKGLVREAWASFLSDLSKHEETRGHSAIELGAMLLEAGHLNSHIEMAKFIEGFR